LFGINVFDDPRRPTGRSVADFCGVSIINALSKEQSPPQLVAQNDLGQLGQARLGLSLELPRLNDTSHGFSPMHSLRLQRIDRSLKSVSGSRYPSFSHLDIIQSTEHEFRRMFCIAAAV
jgi:hypothetical protein